MCHCKTMLDYLYTAVHLSSSRVRRTLQSGGWAICGETPRWSHCDIIAYVINTLCNKVHGVKVKVKLLLQQCRSVSVNYIFPINILHNQGRCFCHGPLLFHVAFYEQRKRLVNVSSVFSATSTYPSPALLASFAQLTLAYPCADVMWKGMTFKAIWLANRGMFTYFSF